MIDKRQNSQFLLTFMEESMSEARWPPRKGPKRSRRSGTQRVHRPLTRAQPAEPPYTRPVRMVVWQGTLATAHLCRFRNCYQACGSLNQMKPSLPTWPPDPLQTGRPSPDST